MLEQVLCMSTLCDRMLEQVFERFEHEMEDSDGELLRATLCLLEVSSHGLLEAELLEILADQDQLMPPKQAAGSEKGRWTDRQAGRQAAGSERGRWTGRQTDRQAAGLEKGR